MKTLAIILTLLVAQAYADNKQEPPDESMEQTQTQTVEQHQEQLQTQNQTQSVDVSGGDGGRGGEATGGNVGDISINARHQRSVPSAFAPAIYPTAPCYKGASVGASGLKFGIAFGAGKPDEACERRELIRLAPETHKLFLFCNEPSLIEIFTSVRACLEHNKEVMPDDGEQDARRTTPRYDDTALTQQIEAVVARVGAVEEQYNESEVRAQQRADKLKNAAVATDPHAAYFAGLEELKQLKRAEK